MAQAICLPGYTGNNEEVTYQVWLNGPHVYNEKLDDDNLSLQTLVGGIMIGHFNLYFLIKVIKYFFIIKNKSEYRIKRSDHIQLLKLETI